MNQPGETRADRTCLACGQVSTSLARFCWHCGATLVWGSAEAAHADATGNLPAAPRSLRAPPPSTHDSAHSVADPLIGRTVADRYRILEQIGRGGMGVVYRVEHARIGKRMALKLLTGELTQDAVQVARFKREALMASRLSHPNTVQVFDFGISDGLVYLAMEYLRGEDLGRIVRREGHLAVDRAEKLVIQIASSLAEAHEKGIVHRDLKPENIVIIRGHSGEEVVKVLDFGLAKLRESSELSDVTSRGAIVGTPYYMSPEQIRSDPVDPRSDVYSLGALMYACLTGEPVFDAATPIGVFTKHLLEAPVPPHLRRPDLRIPERISRIVMRTLEKDPNKRLPSVVALQHLLVEELRTAGQDSVERLLSSGELLRLTDEDAEIATRTEIEHYERKLRRRSRFAFVGLALVGVGVLSGAALAYRRVTAQPDFDGREKEPNDAATQANAVPFGVPVNGMLGKRLDSERSDRDFFRIRVPPNGSGVRLSTTGLPNLASCTWIYPANADSAFGRYCSGAAHRNLLVERLLLPAGDYLVSVMQDRDAYTRAGAPPVHENVSDEYRLELGLAADNAEREGEPNDTAAHPTRLAAPGLSRARLAFMRDVDVFCTRSGERVRFVVEELDDPPRSRDAVLQVKPLTGPDADVPVRVHRAAQGFAPSARDTVAPWKSSWITATSEVCVELTLAPNPWSPAPPDVAPASDTSYVVRTETSPGVAPSR